MCTRYWSFISFWIVWCMWCGLPITMFSCAASMICASITYIFATYLKLLHKKFQLNYRFIFFCFQVAQDIIRSSIAVMKIIWSRHLHITPSFEWIYYGDDNHSICDLELVIYGNAITLTPGTVTVDVNNSMLLVHALEQSSLSGLYRQNTMHRFIRH